jgi:hypothetical protein
MPDTAPTAWLSLRTNPTADGVVLWWILPSTRSLSAMTAVHCPTSGTTSGPVFSLAEIGRWAAIRTLRYRIAKSGYRVRGGGDHGVTRQLGNRTNLLELRGAAETEPVDDFPIAVPATCR